MFCSDGCTNVSGRDCRPVGVTGASHSATVPRGVVGGVASYGLLPPPPRGVTGGSLDGEGTCKSHETWHR